MIEVDCPFCAESFDVPNTMRGGHANCPHCEQLVEIGGTNGGLDVLFWLGIAAAVAFVLAISTGLVAAGHLTAGITVVAVAAAIGGLMYAIS